MLLMGGQTDGWMENQLCIFLIEIPKNAWFGQNPTFFREEK